MATRTEILGLVKPGLEDDADIRVINANMDILDKQIGEVNSVQKYKASWFDSVAAMKAEPSLTAGAYVCTAGYYEANDGGSASYMVRAKADSDTVDNGSLHELANGLVAELIVENGTVCPEQFGAKGNGEAFIKDDIDVIANAFHKAISFCKNNGDIFLSANNTYKVTEPLCFKSVNCDIKGKIISTITDDFAVKIIDCQSNKLKFFKIYSDAGGIRIYGETKTSYNNEIEWHTVCAVTVGFEISGVYPNYDNTIKYTLLKADDICFNVRVDSNNGFITETRVFAGNHGGYKNQNANWILKMVGLSTLVNSLTYLETFYFYNMQFENCVKAMFLDNVTNCMFYNPRTYELNDNTIELTGHTSAINIISPIITFNLFYLHDFKYTSVDPAYNNQPIPLIVRGQLANKGGNKFSSSEGQVTWVFNTDGTPVFTNPLGSINSSSIKWDLTYLKNNSNSMTDPPAFIYIIGGNEVEIDENFYQKNKAVIRVRATSVSEDNVATIKIGGKTFTFNEQYSSYELKNIQKLGSHEWVLEKVTYF